MCCVCCLFVSVGGTYHHGIKLHEVKMKLKYKEYITKGEILNKDKQKCLH